MMFDGIGFIWLILKVHVVEEEEKEEEEEEEEGADFFFTVGVMTFF